MDHQEPPGAIPHSTTTAAGQIAARAQPGRTVGAGRLGHGPPPADMTSPRKKRPTCAGCLSDSVAVFRER